MDLLTVLKRYGRKALTIDHLATVAEAIQIMVAESATALIVSKADLPLGVFSHEDALKCCAGLQGATTSSTLAGLVPNGMVAASPVDTVSSWFTRMVQDNFNHLPVSENGEIIGMVHFRDIARFVVEELTAELTYLQGYVNDLQEAAND